MRISRPLFADLLHRLHDLRVRSARHAHLDGFGLCVRAREQRGRTECRRELQHEASLHRVSPNGSISFYLWLSRRTSQSPNDCTICTNTIRIATTVHITSGR